MDIEALLVDFRHSGFQKNGQINDNPPENQPDTAIKKLSNLFDAIEMVRDLCAAIDPRTGPEFEVQHLNPLLSVLSDYGRQALSELPGGTVYPQAVSA